MEKKIGIDPFNVIYHKIIDDDENDYEEKVSAIETKNGVILRTYTRNFDTVSETVTFVENVTIEDIIGNKPEQES